MKARLRGAAVTVGLFLAASLLACLTMAALI